ncbi:hypothetical protein PTQ35_04210 [Campylobacter sp. 46490-21]|nr:hypothetical protein [Campylobacter magnus]MDD0848021.1 hypothetical protein [Campylobacter magnus]
MNFLVCAKILSKTAIIFSKDKNEWICAFKYYDNLEKKDIKTA